MEETHTAQQMADRIIKAGEEAKEAVDALTYVSTKKDIDRAQAAAEELHAALGEAAEKLPKGQARYKITNIMALLDQGVKGLLCGPHALHHGVTEASKAVPLIASRMTSWVDADIDTLPRRLRRAAEAVRNVGKDRPSTLSFQLVVNYTDRDGCWHVTFCPELKEVFEALWAASEIAAEGPARDELRRECNVLCESLRYCWGGGNSLEHHARVSADMAEQYADLMDTFAWE